MTAPDLVEVVAEALLSVELGRAFDRNEDMVAFKEDLEACRMDARAVLAALTEAGTVEWGIFRKDEAGNTWTPMENARFKTLAKAEIYRKNMFLPAFQEIIEPRFRHVGPWQKLEE